VAWSQSEPQRVPSRISSALPLLENEGLRQVSAPILYVTDHRLQPLRPGGPLRPCFLLRFPEHDLRGVCVPEGSDAERIIAALSVRAGKMVPIVEGVEGLRDALARAEEPVNLVVVEGFSRSPRYYRQTSPVSARR